MRGVTSSTAEPEDEVQADNDFESHPPGSEPELNRGQRRAESRRRGDRKGPQSRKHRRIPPKNLPITMPPDTPVRACSCGWLSVGPNAPGAFLDHLAEKSRPDRRPETKEQADD